MDRSLVIELILRTKSVLDSIQNFVQLSRGKFIDKKYDEFFYQMITNNVEEGDQLLDGFLNYIKATTPIIKKDSVNAVIEQVSKKHQMRLEGKKIKIFKKFEKDLPETIIPDEQLRFVVDSILKYAIASLTSDGSIEILTKSFAHDKTVEIRVAFNDFKKYSGQFAREVRSQVPQKEMALDLLLRLVYVIVQSNQGAIEFETDETKAKRFISLKFPLEKRRVVHYQPIDE